MSVMKKIRMYGLFISEMQPTGRYKYTRLYPEASFPLAQARRMFQTSLLSMTLQGQSVCLHPIDSKKKNHKETK